MKLLSFCLLTTLALVYAGLTVGETMTYRKWQQESLDQKDVQIKVAYFQNLSRIIDSLVRRMAYESQHDPALEQMLKERKIHVVVNGAQATPDVSSAEAVPAGVPPSNPSAPPTDKPAVPGTTSSHP